MKLRGGRDKHAPMLALQFMRGLNEPQNLRQTNALVRFKRLLVRAGLNGRCMWRHLHWLNKKKLKVFLRLCVVTRGIVQKR